MPVLKKSSMTSACDADAGPFAGPSDAPPPVSETLRLTTMNVRSGEAVASKSEGAAADLEALFDARRRERVGVRVDRQADVDVAFEHAPRDPVREGREHAEIGAGRRCDDERARDGALQARGDVHRFRARLERRRALEHERAG